MPREEGTVTPRHAIRSVVGTVLQQPFLYSKALRDNILAGARRTAAHG